MPIATVLLTDTLDLFRQKVNQAIGVMNTLSGAGSILAINSPSTAGQILFFNGTSYTNVALTGAITIDGSGNVVINPGYGGNFTKGRVRFSGSMTSLYG